MPAPRKPVMMVTGVLADADVVGARFRMVKKQRFHIKMAEPPTR